MAKLPPLPTKDRQAGRVATSPGKVFAPLASSGRLRMVPLASVAPDPNQPRKRFNRAKLELLADSIAESGVLQPPIVREPDGEGVYVIVAGERRWRAANMAGLSEIEVLVRDATLTDALMENLVREDLSPIEVARANAALVDDLGITKEELARRTGQSRAGVSNHIRLLDHPDVILDMLDDGRLMFAHGRELLRVDDRALRCRLARQAVKAGWTTRQLETAIKDALQPATPGRRPSADATAFVQKLGDAVSRASGLEVLVSSRGRDRFTFTVTGQDSARALAHRLGADGLDDL